MSQSPGEPGPTTRSFPPATRRRAALLVACAALLVSTAPATARTLEGSAEFEGYAGVYLPGPSVLTTEPVIGFRGGVNVKPKFNLQIDFSYVRSKTTVEPIPGVSADLDFKMSSIAIPFAFQPMPYSRWVPMLYAGPGWAWIDAKVTTDAQFDEPIPDRLKEDSFFIVFGGGVRYFANRNWYVRPDVRFRWFQRRDTDQIDSEIVFAVGYNSL